jgi:heat shock protein HtpX
VSCLGGTDSIAAWTWAAGGRSDWHLSRANDGLQALAHRAASAGQQVFTAQDLRDHCTAWLDAQLPADVRRQLHCFINEGRSGRVLAGLTVLLALCGWIGGGEEGARRAVVGGLPASTPPNSARESMWRRHDTRRLSSIDAPELFELVRAICRRAGLRHIPELHVLHAERGMNAYALGTPNDAVITLTDGLLRGMTRGEVAAIVAHEIAHVCNDDASKMAMAASMHRAIRLVSAATLAASHGTAWRHPLPWLLYSAPAIAELLCLGLSRIRELAADAFALELIAEPQTLASALEKLERHHRSAHAEFDRGPDTALASYLRSHPATEQRVSFVRGLA